MDGGGGGIRSTSAATTTEAIAAIAEHTRERERERERERARGARESRGEEDLGWTGLPPSITRVRIAMLRWRYVASYVGVAGRSFWPPISFYIILALSGGNTIHHT